MVGDGPGNGFQEQVGSERKSRLLLVSIRHRPLSKMCLERKYQSPLAANRESSCVHCSAVQKALAAQARTLGCAKLLQCCDEELMADYIEVCVPTVCLWTGTCFVPLNLHCLL